MKNIVIILLFFCVSLLLACDDDGLRDGEWAPLIATNPGSQADLGIVTGGLYNGDMEIENGVESNLPSGWKDLVNAFNPPNNYDFEHTSAVAIGDFSTSITGANIDSQNEFGFLRQIIENPDIVPGTFLRLRGKARTVNLSGNGFNIWVLGYDLDGNQIFGLETFAETRFVTGTRNWTEYVTNIDSVPLGVVQLQVFLSIGRSTTGTVYFDDIVLEVD
ncbi:MAG: hypothetical protein ACPGJS_12385 [Flammeovirgaceae bacterium]